MSKKVVEVKTLKVGKYVILDGEASKIVNIQTSSLENTGQPRPGWMLLEFSIIRKEVLLNR